MESRQLAMLMSQMLHTTETIFSMLKFLQEIEFF